MNKMPYEIWEDIERQRRKDLRDYIFLIIMLVIAPTVVIASVIASMLVQVTRLERQLDMATQVQIVTTHRNNVAQKLRASISYALACSKEGDMAQLRTAMKLFELSCEEFKLAIK